MNMNLNIKDFAPIVQMSSTTLLEDIKVCKQIKFILTVIVII